ncbi:MAG: nitroreductase family protein [Desulfobacteraceae bacterium]|nr:nitroreductase family protein [Desulfobacteraceae bacterium]
MMIRLLEERCKPCLLCVRDCAAGAWREDNGRPVMAAPEVCNRCGHCVAVCPRRAIVHNALDQDQIRRTDRALLAPEIYKEIVRGRRSIRHYRPQAVPVETIEAILALASHSPTASNKQNVGYTIITDPRLLDKISRTVFGIARWIYARTRTFPGKWIYLLFKKLSPANDLERYLTVMEYYLDQTQKGRDYILHRAPLLILAHGPRKGSFHGENCNIAAANIMNYAHAMGLGTCYIGFLGIALKFSRPLRQLVQTPKGRKVYACLVMGYPAFRHRYTSSRKKPVIQWIDGNAGQRHTAMGEGSANQAVPPSP